MIALLQRVTQANVKVNQEVVGEIEQGVLCFLGVEKNDQEQQACRLVERILSYRIFADAEDKMNLCVKDIGGGVLLVPQFTLAADTRKGNRPSFSSAAPPTLGEALFDFSVQHAKRLHHKVETGVFGADMKIQLLNDGPVTFILTEKAKEV